MVSKIYYCYVYPVASNERLSRAPLESDLVRLCSSDFPKLLQHGFCVFVIEYDTFSTLDTPGGRAYYRSCYRRARRAADFIIIHHKLPPKL